MMVRVGVIGTSWWADSMYLPALKKHPQARVAAVCGRDYKRLQDFARQWDIPATYTDYRHLIRDGGVDAVIVATTNDSHYPITMEALEQGLHVLCDKPLAQNAVHAREMADAARRAGVKTMVPLTYRYMPTTRYVKQLVDQGFIGRPYHLNLRYYTGYGRQAKYDWRFNADIAGSGVVGDLGSHWLHLARWFYGEVTAIFCHADTLVERPNGPDDYDYTRGEDTAVMTVKFANGAYGVLHVTTLCHEGTQLGQTHHMEFHGSDGTLYNHIDWDTVQQVRGCRAGEASTVLDVPDDVWAGARRDTVHNTYRDIFREQDHMTREFVSAIVANGASYPDFEEGARVQELVDAALASARSGCWVQVEVS
jgi:predicted dehydrogenase